MATRKRKPKDLRAGVEPSVRVFTTWTPAMIRAAEQQADNGQLSYAANLCDWLLGDDRIGPVLHSRVQALLGLNPTFEPSGDKRRSNRAVNALDAQEDWWTAYPEPEFNLLVTWGLLLGVAPAQHQWQQFEDHGNRILPLPEFWHPQHLRYDWATRHWMIKVQADAASYGAWQEQELVPGDATWILHTPYGKNRPWSMGLWRNLSRLALLKSMATDDWARTSANSGILTATSPEASKATKIQRDELANDLYERGRDAVAALPPGFDLKLVATTANTEQLFNAQIQMANTAIAIAIRGGNLSTEIKGGSLAAAESQQETGDEPRLRFDAQGLTTTIHDQSLVWWAEFNFGDRKLAPWPVYPVEQDEDLSKKADTATKAATAATQLQALGFEIDPQGFVDEFELSGWVKAPKALPKPAPVAEPGKPGQEPPPAKPDPQQPPEERPN